MTTTEIEQRLNAGWIVYLIQCTGKAERYIMQNPDHEGVEFSLNWADLVPFKKRLAEFVHCGLRAWRVQCR